MIRLKKRARASFVIMRIITIFIDDRIIMIYNPY